MIHIISVHLQPSLLRNTDAAATNVSLTYRIGESSSIDSSPLLNVGINIRNGTSRSSSAIAEERSTSRLTEALMVAICFSQSSVQSRSKDVRLAAIWQCDIVREIHRKSFLIAIYGCDFRLIEEQRQLPSVPVSRGRRTYLQLFILTL